MSQHRAMYVGLRVTEIFLRTAETLGSWRAIAGCAVGFGYGLFHAGSAGLGSVCLIVGLWTAYWAGDAGVERP